MFGLEAILSDSAAGPKERTNHPVCDLSVSVQSVENGILHDSQSNGIIERACSCCRVQSVRKVP